MSRTRTIKPGFFRSESLSECSVEARLTFAGLWTEADDEGRGDATPRLLATALWPWDDPSDDMVRGWLEELAGTGHIVLYQHRNKRLYQIINWSDHQSAAYRRGGSTLPAPPEIPPPDTDLHKSARRVVQESAEVCLSRAEGKGVEWKGAAAEVEIVDDVAAAALDMLIEFRVATTARDNPEGLRFALRRDLPSEWGAKIATHLKWHPYATPADVARDVLGVPGVGDPAEAPREPDWYADPNCEHCPGDGIARLDDIGQGTFGACSCRRAEKYPEPAQQLADDANAGRVIPFSRKDAS